MRRVRDKDGQRWLVLNAAVSARLAALLDADPDAGGLGRTDAEHQHLPATVIAELTDRYRAGDGGRVHALGHNELKAIAKRHGLGVYSLRERLLSDPRFRKGADQRLEVTL